MIVICELHYPGKRPSFHPRSESRRIMLIEIIFVNIPSPQNSLGHVSDRCGDIGIVLTEHACERESLVLEAGPFSHELQIPHSPKAKPMHGQVIQSSSSGPHVGLGLLVH